VAKITADAQAKDRLERLERLEREVRHQKERQQIKALGLKPRGQGKDQGRGR